MRAAVDFASTHDDIVEQIYRDFCSSRPGSTAIQSLQSVFKATKAGLFITPAQANTITFDFMITHGFKPDPAVDQKVTQLLSRTTGELSRFWPRNSSLVTKYVNYFENVSSGLDGELSEVMLSLDNGYAMMTPCLDEYGSRYFLFLSRSRSGRPFEEMDGQLMADFAPHFRSALLAHIPIAAAYAAGEFWHSGLDQLGVGVVRLGANQEVQEITPAAAAIFGQHDGLECSAHISCTDPSADRQLSDLIQKASLPEWSEGGVALSVPRASGKPGFHLVVDALSRPAGAQSDGGVIIYVRDHARESSNLIQLDLLQELFGLTRAEALVAREAANGYTSREIAASLGIQQTTVRTHLRSIYGKSEASGRVGLVQAILNGSATFGGGYRDRGLATKDFANAPQ